MIIREAQLSDITALSKLAQKTYSETFGHSMSPDELAAELEAHKSERYFESAMTEDKDVFLLAESDGRLMGYIGLRHPRMEVEGRTPTNRDQAMNGIYVHSDFQGQGIGKALMQAAFLHPRFKTAQNIYLSVWEENKRAYQFYLRSGFKVIGKKTSL